MSQDQKHILAVDVGNSNTVFGLLTRQGEIKHDWRTVTRRDRTSDEFGIFLLSFLEAAGVNPKSIVGSIYSSVVPGLNPILERMVEDYFANTPIRVHYTMSLPITIDYPQPAEIGADRLVNAVAAHLEYGGNLIVIDLGTATTFCVLEDGVYLGGCIAPGLKLSMQSLASNTAQLPPIEFRRPPGIIGESTVYALQSGFFYGWIGLLREICMRLRARDSSRTYRVIATGGLASAMHAEEPSLFDEIDSNLTLKGLAHIYQHLMNN